MGLSLEKITVSVDDACSTSSQSISKRQNIVGFASDGVSMPPPPSPMTILSALCFNHVLWGLNQVADAPSNFMLSSAHTLTTPSSPREKLTRLAPSSLIDESTHVAPRIR